MRRRDFVKAIASSSVAWPLAARAQQTDQVRRVGVLMNVAPEHPEGQPFVAAFRQALQRLGWIEGRNLAIAGHQFLEMQNAQQFLTADGCGAGADGVARVCFATGGAICRRPP